MASAISTGSAPAHTYTAPNTYMVKLIASSAFCSDSLKQTVLLNETNRQFCYQFLCGMFATFC